MNSLASSAADGMNEAHSGVKQPVRICIAALGGEGGSVLTSWLVALAKAQDWPVQSTSVPGVAQRTGATTYYLEILPERWQGHGRPVLALTPTPGFVDVVVASELLEAGRAIEQGLVSPERTTVIASTHRAYLIEEKSAMSDERVPTDRIVKAVDQLSARAIYMDFAELAREAGAVVSSVIFGAIAGAGVLPAPRESFETALRESGIAVEANLRGFAAAYDAVTVGRRPRDDTNPESTPEFRPRRSGFPAEIDAVVSAGIERLTEYQGSWYAERYSSAVRRVFEAEISSGDEGAGWPITREVARYLALMMSYEDIIRVAALKTAPARWRELHGRHRLGARDVMKVTEFLKPGLEEFASMLPARIGRGIISWAERRGKLEAYNVGLGIRTTTIAGFLTLRVLAQLRSWRPYSLRYGQEMAAIDDWVELVVAATRIAPEFGAEVVECARMRKGYGSTHRRGNANFRILMDGIVKPAIASNSSAAQLVSSLRKTALSDPDGTAMLDEIKIRSRDDAVLQE